MNKNCDGNSSHVSSHVLILNCTVMFTLIYYTGLSDLFKHLHLRLRLIKD